MVPDHRVRPHALVFGLSATGLAVARALGRRGYTVQGIDPRRWEIGFRSRYVDGRVATVVQYLDGLRNGDPPDPSERSVVFTCGDPELLAVAERATELAPWAFLPRSYLDGTASAIVDKRSLYQRVQSTAGIDCPETIFSADPGELRGLAAQIRGPWVVKPALAGASKVRPFPEKARLVTDVRNLAAWPDVIVQTYVPGPITEVYAWTAHVGGDGAIGPWATVRKLGERPAPFGSASRAITVDDSEVETKSRRLVIGLGLTGPVSVEWKRHGGRLWLIEVNPRPVLWSGVSESVIVDSFQSLRGAPRPPAVAARPGIRWRYAIREGFFGRRADVDALWAIDDPAPGLLGPAYTALLSAGRLFGRRF